VDAYSDPDLMSDVTTFDTNFGLQAFNVANGPTFTIVGETNKTIPQVPSPGDWDIEQSLDVEWAHAIAPMANIVMVEASSQDSNLYTAAVQAANIPGVSVVSMSWGFPESFGETSIDSDFVTPAGHEGVVFVASTGDSGVPGVYPAYSPNVVAVGGTSLTINSDGTYGGETAWNLVDTSQGYEGGGGGVSSYETQPSYQTGKVNGDSTSKRTIPDISWLADPNTGVDVYDSFYTKSSNHYYQVGGTSLAAPMMAALFAIIDQGRALQGETPLDGRSQALPLLYNSPSSDFHDITSGNNGDPATTGYDLATGLGSPIPTALVNSLVNVPTFYVDAAAPGPTFDGSSWSSAFTTLQSALSVATGGDRILVGEGSYYPGTSRSSTFTLTNGVDVYGGYAGYGASNPNAQNPSQYPTILSGDIGVVGNASDNVYHVVSASSDTPGTTLDGFTIEFGNADSSAPIPDGGGLYANLNGPTVIDCTFLDNSAYASGGGVYIAGTSTTHPGSGVFINCVFVGNSAAKGGADSGFDAGQTFTNCTFTQNTSSSAGEALYIQNLTAILTNCILWADTGTGDEIDTTGATVTVTYSDISGGYSGTGNISASPLFLLAPSAGGVGNLELSSTSSAIDTGSNAAVYPFEATDIVGNTRIVAYPGSGVTTPTVDMGAYEAQIPSVVSAAVLTPSAQQISVQFSQNVSASLVANNLTLIALAGGPAPSVSSLSYNNTTNEATFILSGSLPAGIYQFTVGGAGAHLSASYTFDLLFMPANSTLALTGEQTFNVQQFYMDPSASLDIGDNAIAVSYAGTSPATTIGALIASAYNGGSWNGPGITSSDVVAGSGVGYFDSGSQVTVRLTWDGDANLNGSVDSDDLSLIMLGQAENNTSWQAGNFNYDSKVNADDWTLLSLGDAVSNDQTFNSAAIVSNALPANRNNASAMTITPTSLFSATQAVLDSGTIGSLLA
jgi:subtilase family serine protease